MREGCADAQDEIVRTRFESPSLKSLERNWRERVSDLRSYLRRRTASGHAAPLAEHELIELDSIGGAISTSYVDIACVAPPAPAPPVEKARAKSPPTVNPPIANPTPTSPAPISPPASPQAPPNQPPAAPARQQRQPAPPSGQANGPRPIARPRRRTDGNGAAPSERKALLSIHGLAKSFVGRTVVRGVSLYVRKGEAVGLLGPNGAGKTTVFYMITGLIKADEGRIELDGCDVTQLPMYQRARLGIGYLPQEASIFRGLTVEENIRAVLEVIEPDRGRRERDLDALLEEFDIARLRKTPAIALSGGERRRVEIARSLATRPHYMLLDEPFAGIDPIAVGDIQALVRHLTNRGIGVLITDHNVRETLGLTDRAYIIYSGQVLMEGRADDIVNNPDVRRLYLGEEFRL
jgi:lipopolysaccharide export system ATP-binding protein